MKTGCFGWSNSTITVAVLFLNVIFNGVLVIKADQKLMNNLKIDAGFNYFVIISETFLSWLTIAFISEKTISRAILFWKYWLLGCVVGLLFLDIFSFYSIIVILCQKNLHSDGKVVENHDEKPTYNLSVLVIALISYCAFKFYVVAITVSFASDRTNLISTDDEIDVEQNALRNNEDDVPPLSPPPAYDVCFIESAPKVSETPPPSYDVAVIFKY